VTLGPVRMMGTGMKLKMYAIEVRNYMRTNVSNLFICPISYVCVVRCPLLTDPHIETITCSLGDDEIPSYEDTCSFTCNTGYELTGSDTRTCQSNGSWSGSDDLCKSSVY